MGYVAEVHAPDLVPPRGLEGHLLLFFGAQEGLLEAVELAVDGEDASTGARTQVNAQLLQRCRDAKLAELGVLLKLPHLVHRPKVHLAHAFAGLVLQAVYAFGDPLLQRSVDGGAAGLQIAGDAFDVPALGVQRHDGQTALFGLFYLVVGLEAAKHPHGRGPRFEYPSHRPAVRPLAETDVANGGYLVDPHRGVLGLEVQDEPADFRVQSAAPRGGLLGPLQEQLKLPPVLGGFDPRASGHLPLPSSDTLPSPASL